MKDCSHQQGLKYCVDRKKKREWRRRKEEEKWKQLKNDILLDAYKNVFYFLKLKIKRKLSFSHFIQFF